MIQKKFQLFTVLRAFSSFPIFGQAKALKINSKILISHNKIEIYSPLKFLQFDNCLLLQPSYTSWQWELYGNDISWCLESRKYPCDRQVTEKVKYAIKTKTEWTVWQS